MNIIYGDISLVIFLVDLRTTPIHDSGLNDESSTLDWWPIYLANSDKLHADNIEGLVDCSDVKHDRCCLSRSHIKSHVEKTNDER